MTRDELITLLKKNLKPNTKIDFLLIGENPAFLNIVNVCMNVDIDDPENKKRGGIVFGIKEKL